MPLDVLDQWRYVRPELARACRAIVVCVGVGRPLDDRRVERAAHVSGHPTVQFFDRRDQEVIEDLSSEVRIIDADVDVARRDLDSAY